jgi:hypothetical protein
LSLSFLIISQDHTNASEQYQQKPTSSNDEAPKIHVSKIGEGEESKIEEKDESKHANNAGERSKYDELVQAMDRLFPFSDLRDSYMSSCQSNIQIYAKLRMIDEEVRFFDDFIFILLSIMLINGVV